MRLASGASLPRPTHWAGAQGPEAPACSGSHSTSTTSPGERRVSGPTPTPGWDLHFNEARLELLQPETLSPSTNEAGVSCSPRGAESGPKSRWFQSWLRRVPVTLTKSPTYSANLGVLLFDAGIP